MKIVIFKKYIDSIIRAGAPERKEIVYCEDAGIAHTVTTAPHITIHATNYEIDNPYIKAGSTVTVTITNTS